MRVPPVRRFLMESVVGLVQRVEVVPGRSRQDAAADDAAVAVLLEDVGAYLEQTRFGLLLVGELLHRVAVTRSASPRPGLALLARNRVRGRGRADVLAVVDVRSHGRLSSSNNIRASAAPW